MDNMISIKCTAESEEEKKQIQESFKKNHISMAGYVMEMLRRKSQELRK